MQSVGVRAPVSRQSCPDSTGFGRTPSESLWLRQAKYGSTMRSTGELRHLRGTAEIQQLVISARAISRLRSSRPLDMHPPAVHAPDRGVAGARWVRAGRRASAPARLWARSPSRAPRRRPRRPRRLARSSTATCPPARRPAGAVVRVLVGLRAGRGGELLRAAPARTSRSASCSPAMPARERAAGCRTTPGAGFSWPLTLEIHETGPGASMGARVARVTRL